MARALTRAIPLSLKSSLTRATTARFLSISSTLFIPCLKDSTLFGLRAVTDLGVCATRRVLSGVDWRVWCRGSHKGYRKARRRVLKNANKEKEVELIVKILIEEGLPNDPEILNIAEMLRLNAPMAMKLAFDGLKDLDYKTRDSAIGDIGGFENVELSILLCNDEFIRKLNKEWRGEDHATDVLSMSQHIPGLKLPILVLGDIVISVETAARQADERGHTLLDEIRILLVHGLLHLLGFDHEISEEAEAEMEKEEELLLKSLDWKGKGLIKSAHDAENTESLHTLNLDGTLLNSESQITPNTANALRDALSKGVKVVIATGKSRPAAISVLRKVGLAGKDGVVSESSPGVFLQVYQFTPWEFLLCWPYYVPSSSLFFLYDNAPHSSHSSVSIGNALIFARGLLWTHRFSLCLFPMLEVRLYCFLQDVNTTPDWIIICEGKKSN
ncbi:hypothetical protein Dimus_019287 [Dionaea muscipula]